MFSKQSVATQAAQRSSTFRSMRSIISFLLFSMIFQSSLRVSAQTMITGAQIRNPLTPVAVLPAACSPYSVYFLTTTAVLYICTAANTLTPYYPGQSGSANLAATIPPLTGTAGYLYTNGTNISWGNLIAGGSGALDCSTTPGQCDIVSSMVPRLTSANSWLGANDFSGAAWTKPFASASSAPATPQEGQAYYDTSVHAPSYYNGSSFTSFGGGGGTTILNSSGTLSNAKVFIFTVSVSGY